MKIRYIITSLIAVLFISSCSLSKMNRQYRNTIEGTWELTNVDYKGNSGLFKSTVFNDTQAVCFEGSEWFFRKSNSTGTYTINKPGNCINGTRYIRWSVYEPDIGGYQLQFKFTNEKKKAISKNGYRLDIKQLTDTEMVLSSKNMVDGKSVNLEYTFKKL